jgi:hypothetical protein
MTQKKSKLYTIAENGIPYLILTSIALAVLLVICCGILLATRGCQADTQPSGKPTDTTAATTDTGSTTTPDPNDSVTLPETANAGQAYQEDQYTCGGFHSFSPLSFCVRIQGDRSKRSDRVCGMPAGEGIALRLYV